MEREEAPFMDQRTSRKRRSPVQIGGTLGREEAPVQIRGPLGREEVPCTESRPFVRIRDFLWRWETRIDKKSYKEKIFHVQSRRPLGREEATCIDRRPSRKMGAPLHRLEALGKERRPPYGSEDL